MQMQHPSRLQLPAQLLPDPPGLWSSSPTTHNQECSSGLAGLLACSSSGGAAPTTPGAAGAGIGALAQPQLGLSAVLELLLDGVPQTPAAGAASPTIAAAATQHPPLPGSSGQQALSDAQRSAVLAAIQALTQANQLLQQAAPSSGSAAAAAAAAAAAFAAAPGQQAATAAPGAVQLVQNQLLQQVQQLVGMLLPGSGDGDDGTASLAPQHHPQAPQLAQLATASPPVSSAVDWPSFVLGNGLSTSNGLSSYAAVPSQQPQQQQVRVHAFTQSDTSLSLLGSSTGSTSSGCFLLAGPAGAASAGIPISSALAAHSGSSGSFGGFSIGSMAGTPPVYAAAGPQPVALSTAALLPATGGGSLAQAWGVVQPGPPPQQPHAPVLRRSSTGHSSSMSCSSAQSVGRLPSPLGFDSSRAAPGHNHQLQQQQQGWGVRRTLSSPASALAAALPVPGAAPAQQASGLAAAPEPGGIRAPAGRDAHQRACGHLGSAAAAAFAGRRGSCLGTSAPSGTGVFMPQARAGGGGVSGSLPVKGTGAFLPPSVVAAAIRGASHGMGGGSSE